MSIKKILISESADIDKQCEDVINALGGDAETYYLPQYLNTSHSSLNKMCNYFSGKYDGLILGGGGDVNPAIYGEKVNGSVQIDDIRDAIEFKLIEEFMKLGKPILGICRGFQIMNIALGGTIYQDNGTECNAYHASPGNAFRTHKTYCNPSFLMELYGDEFTVNSWHHQSLKKLADNLVPIQYSFDYRCIEGVVHKTYPYIGVQWHPEYLCKPNENEKNCIDGTLIFKYFMSLSAHTGINTQERKMEERL